MFVWIQGDSWCPGHVENRKVVGLEQGVDTASIDRTKGLLEVAAIRDESGEDVAHGQGRRLFGQGLMTTCDDVFDKQRHFNRLERSLGIGEGG
jgi:hypothetical protein